jgi:hypothetical protein
MIAAIIVLYASQLSWMRNRCEVFAQLSVEMPILWYILRHSLLQQVPVRAGSEEDSPQGNKHDPDVKETRSEVVTN